jgi:hypothetical protein
VPSTAIWCLLAIVMFCIAVVQRWHGFAIPGTFLFSLFGLYLFAGRFVVDAMAHANTTYALTTHRALIVRSGLFSHFEAVTLKEVVQVELHNERNGYGTVRFGHLPPSRPRQAGGPSMVPSFDPIAQFLAIENPRFVLDLVKQAM